MSDHLSKQFDLELENIRTRILQMGGLVERQVLAAVDAFSTGNLQEMQQVIDTDPDVFLSVFDIYAETEMAPWLHEVKHPCLVLTGENDGGCNPRLNKQIADALGDSELVILPVLRHAILLEASDQVAPPVLDFLRRHPMR